MKRKCPREVGYRNSKRTYLEQRQGEFQYVFKLTCLVEREEKLTV
ncbi:MAG: hypothetical protein ACFFBV_00030 [Promethearchaeota archaeon]